MCGFKPDLVCEKINHKINRQISRYSHKINLL